MLRFLGMLTTCTSTSKAPSILWLPMSPEHGLQGAIISAGLMRSIRLLRRTIADPKELLIALNTELRPELLPGQFVTVCAGTLDIETKIMRICLAGHHPCMVLNPHADIVVSRLGQPGMVLGIVDSEQFAASLSVDEIQLSPGDMVVQCTDGIIEASTAKKNTGLCAWLRACCCARSRAERRWHLARCGGSSRILLRRRSRR